ncbi:MAG: hypothetical protein CMP23_05535 [Rickettsiales bacterium]|nr:hypothetical protein [Rickettsiales bacterium]
MKNLLNNGLKSLALRGPSFMAVLLTLILAACVVPGGDSAPSGIDDVNDIPIPSQDLDDDVNDDSIGDDDDTSDDVNDDTNDDVNDDTNDDVNDDTNDEVNDDTNDEVNDDTNDEVNDDTNDDVNDDTNGDDDDTTPEPTSPVSYTITDADSLLYVQVFKDTSSWLSSLAHDHVMRATNWTGSFQYDPADLSSCNFNISIDVDQLVVDEDAMRSYVGYGDTINSNDRNTIRNNMLDEGQLNADSYSQIRVISTSCGSGSGAGTSNGNLPVTAQMTLRGVTKSKSMNLDLTLQNGEAYMQGSFNLTATEFGFSPYQFLGGGVRNLDTMTISFDMVGFSND